MNILRKIIGIAILLAVGIVAGIWAERSNTISFITQFIPPYTTCSIGHFDSVNVVLGLTKESRDLNYDFASFKNTIEKNLDYVMEDSSFPLYSERPDLYRITSIPTSKWSNFFPAKNALNIIFYIRKLIEAEADTDPQYALVVIKAIQGQRLQVSRLYVLPTIDQRSVDDVLEKAVRGTHCFNINKITK